MTSPDEIIDWILEREGPGTPPDYLAKDDAGGRTHHGISERAHPAEWKNGPPTKARCRVIYFETYVQPFDAIPDRYEKLRVCAIDDGVMRGVNTAIKRLQWVLGAKMDGVIGPETLARIVLRRPNELLQAHVIERCVRLCRIVQARPSDATFIAGWVTRALSFLPQA